MAVVKGWDASKKKADEHKGGGHFLKLENDNDSCVVAFLGDPIARETIWMGNRTEEFDPAKHAGQSPSCKIRINCYVFTFNGAELNKLKICEFAPRHFQHIFNAREKYGLEGKAFEIKRAGAANDTNVAYSVLLDQRTISAEDWTALTKLDLIDLEKSGDDSSGGNASAGSNGASGQSAAPSTIDENKAVALVGRLKVLPREKLDQFLTRFGVKRVRDLNATDSDAAEAYVAELEGKGASTEVDPFA